MIPGSSPVDKNGRLPARLQANNLWNMKNIRIPARFLVKSLKATRVRNNLSPFQFLEANLSNLVCATISLRQSPHTRLRQTTNRGHLETRNIYVYGLWFTHVHQLLALSNHRPLSPIWQSLYRLDFCRKNYNDWASTYRPNERRKQEAEEKWDPSWPGEWPPSSTLQMRWSRTCWAGWRTQWRRESRGRTRLQRVWQWGRLLPSHHRSFEDFWKRQINEERVKILSDWNFYRIHGRSTFQSGNIVNMASWRGKNSVRQWEIWPSGRSSKS